MSNVGCVSLLFKLFKMPELQTFCSVLKPIFVTNFMLGMGCILTFKSQWKKLLEIVYSTSYLIFLCALLYYTDGLLNHQIMKSMVYMNQTFIKLSFYVNMSFTIVLIIVMKFKSKELRKSIDMIETCNRRMQRLGLPLRYHSLYRYQIYVIIIYTCVIGINAVYMYTTEFVASVPRITKLILVISWNNFWAVIHISDISFYTLIRHMNMRFQQLNDLLRDMQNKTPNLPRRNRVPMTMFDLETKKLSYFKDENYRGRNCNAASMRIVKEIHLELSKITKVVNDTYGVQILMTTSVSFTASTSLLYISYKILLFNMSMENFLEDIIPIFIWIVYFAVKFCTLSYICVTTITAAADTGYIICELYESSATKEFRLEIRDFMLQLIQNPLQFKACGFFTIDHNFLQTIVRTITTYLVILIQVGDSPKPVDTLLSNNTII